MINKNEFMKYIVSDLKDFFEATEGFKREVIKELVNCCPQNCSTPVEEFTIQEQIKNYLLELSTVTVDDLGKIFSSYPLLQTMELVLGEKLGYLSFATLLWLIEVDNTIGAFTSIPLTKEKMADIFEEDIPFSDGNDITR
ncbi:MAG: hypothetical protein NTX88_08600 [Candidatus Atribacteria bacterium]|nr:hypothetical protein [Candidatus Atribacteria bacterium]